MAPIFYIVFTIKNLVLDLQCSVKTSNSFPFMLKNQMPNSRAH